MDGVSRVRLHTRTPGAHGPPKALLYNLHTPAPGLHLCMPIMLAPVTVHEAAAPVEQTPPPPLLGYQRPNDPPITINCYLPDGVVLTPASDRFTPDPDLLVGIGHHPESTPAMREQLRATVAAFKDVIAFSLLDLKEPYHGAAGALHIRQESDVPAFVRPRRHGFLKDRIADIFYSELEKAGIIEPAPHSKSASNTTFAHKKAPDGSITDIRVCVNYAAQNDLSASQHTHFPVAEELFQEIGDSRWFSKIDLKSGFMQIPIDPASMDYSAFWWGTNLYRYTRMPFGLKQCPAAYQRVMDIEFGRAGLNYCTKVFLDDILVHSPTFEQHLIDIEKVLACLRAVNLKLHPAKSHFGIDTIDFLGFDVSQFGLTPQVAKVQALMDIPHPRCAQELRIVMGKIRYYGCFCEKFSEKARPLNDLLKKDVPWTWDPAVHGAAFDLLRNEIATPGKALKRFDRALPVFVHTDFSCKGIGAVLSQVDADGNEYMVACISRSLNSAEANYPSYKGECLAAVWAVKEFSSYLAGLFFTLVTDHEPLRWLTTNKELEGSMARWACALQQFDFTIVHRAGDKHQNADALSRFPRASDADRTGARMDPAPVNGPSVSLAPVQLVDLELYHPIMLGGYADAFNVRQTVQLDTRVHTFATRSLAHNTAVILYEPCGGLCAGLEALLRNGIFVTRYIYSDTSPAAQIVALHRISSLHETYPALFPPSASTAALTTLPMDITTITSADLIQAGADEGGQWVLIAGPPCQDFSPAGFSRGQRGTRAPVLRACIWIIGALQQLQHLHRPLYLLENAAMQYNFRSAEIRNVEFPALCMRIGDPVPLDAALFGSYAHRLRNFWSNFAYAPDVRSALAHTVRPTGINVDSILDASRFSSWVDRADAFPFCRANIPGTPRSALPTMVTFGMSRAFRLGCPGAIYDTQLGGWDEPNPDERERALGYPTGATAAPGLTLTDRHVITGNCIDQAALTGLIRTFLTVTVPPVLLPNLQYTPVHHHIPLIASLSLNKPQYISDSRMSEISFFLAHNPVNFPVIVAPVNIPATQPTQAYDAPLSHREITPAAELRGNKRLASAANEPAQVDIHDDLPVLCFLLENKFPANLTHAQSRRIARRAKAYRAQRISPTEVLIHRLMHNGTLRVVPPKPDRQAAIESAHRLSGHFGVARTLHLLMQHFWWQGIMANVAFVLRQCQVCSRVRASFDVPSTSMTSTPINGLFYAWGVDTSGPFPLSKRGNTYIMHAIEYFSGVLILEPMPNKEARNTAYAFKHGVLERFGACAQVLTDNGTEYQGDFHALLGECFIDHRQSSPNHPQANGLVERSVQTIKQALRRHCEDTLRVDTWDEKLPFVSLAYNCSRQSATRCSPYMLLYAREPVFPSSTLRDHMRVPLPPMDATSPQAVTAAVTGLLDRANYIESITPTIANNLAIAHHRDTLRYARTRSGNYLPRLRKFAVGDFVYMRRPNALNTLQIPAKQLILRIVEARPTGIMVLQGRCGTLISNHVKNLAPCHLPFIEGTLHPELAVPSPDKACLRCSSPDDEARMLLCDVCGDAWHMYCLQPPLTAVPKGNWMCPQCHASGLREVPPQIPRQLGPAPTAADLSERLFTNTATRARDHAAQLLDGSLVSKQVKGKRKGKKITLWGTATFRGHVYRPHYFAVRYSDGSEEILTDKLLQQRSPQPPHAAHAITCRP